MWLPKRLDYSEFFQNFWTKNLDANKNGTGGQTKQGGEKKIKRKATIKNH